MSSYQWAHAIAPGAHILLVQSYNSSLSSLMSAVDYARKQSGVVAISLSWGGTETSTQTTYDKYLTTPTGHTGITFVAASGDTGAVPLYPSVSSNVVSVGGTTLSLSGSDYLSESGWSGSGGGVSKYIAKPSFQATVTQSSTKRTTPDVAYDANPASGVYVYFTGSGATTGSWLTVGGTSAGAPQWAALVAIVGQGRSLSGKAPLNGKTELLPALYNLPATDFHDVVTGSTQSGTTILKAGVGYDLVTGRGTPRANLVVSHLVSVGTSFASSVKTVGATTSTSSKLATSAFDVGPEVSAISAQGIFTEVDPPPAFDAALDFVETATEGGPVATVYESAIITTETSRPATEGAVSRVIWSLAMPIAESRPIKTASKNTGSDVTVELAANVATSRRLTTPQRDLRQDTSKLQLFSELARS